MTITMTAPVGDLQTDVEFDAYWEEEARNPHRNRIRIGRQYQATIPPKLKAGEGDGRKLDSVETISWRKDHGISDEKLDDYFFSSRALGLLARFKVGKPRADPVEQVDNETVDKNGLALPLTPTTSSPPKNGICSSQSETTSTLNNKSSSLPKKKDPIPTESSPLNGNLKAVTVESELMDMTRFVHGHHPANKDSSCSSDDSEGKTDKWSLKEARLYSHALENYGKNFGAIKKALTWKPAKKIIEHYYKSGGNNNGGSGGGSGNNGSGGSSGDASDDENLDSINSPGGDGDANSTSNTNKSNNTTSTTTTPGINPKGITQTIQVACFAGTTDTSLINGYLSSSFDFNSDINNKLNGVVKKTVPQVNGFDQDPYALLGNSIDGAEVKAVRAKPIYKTEETTCGEKNGDNNSVLGSLKFFMDGQLVLKLNAKQEEKNKDSESPSLASNSKCQWIESQDSPKLKKTKSKRYLKHKRSDVSLDSTGRSVINDGSSGSSGRASVISEDTGEEEESSDEDDVGSLGSSESRSLPSPSLQGLTPRKGSNPTIPSNSSSNNLVRNKLPDPVMVVGHSHHIPIIPSPLVSRRNSPSLSPSSLKGVRDKGTSEANKRDFSVFAFQDEDSPPASLALSVKSPLGSPSSVGAKKLSTPLSAKKRFKTTGGSTGSSAVSLSAVFSRPEDKNINSSLNALRTIATSPSVSALDLSSPKASPVDDCAVDLSVRPGSAKKTDRKVNHVQQQVS